MSVDLTQRWAVVLDDHGSMDVYESRDQAEAARVYADATLPLVRVDYHLIDPGKEADR